MYLQETKGIAARITKNREFIVPYFIRYDEYWLPHVVSFNTGLDRANTLMQRSTEVTL